jgi:RNA polymerase sigma-70 factor (ECF subfamily)
MKNEKDSCKEEVFNTIYREYSQSLRNFVFFKCADTAQSHDITQEAFIKLWNNCKKVAPEKAKSFLFTVANNLFLNVVAHKKVVLNFKKEKTSGLNEQSPQYLLEEKEFGERLSQAIAGLTEVQRTAFLLSRVEGKKYKEIAEILGISEKATGKRIHDALEALRTQIEKI